VDTHQLVQTRADNNPKIPAENNITLKSKKVSEIVSQEKNKYLIHQNFVLHAFQN
jgi:hypothetical protein